MGDRWEYGQLYIWRVYETDVWPHDRKIEARWWTTGDQGEAIEFSNATSVLNDLGRDGWELVQIEEERIAAAGGKVGPVQTDRTEWTARRYWMKRRSPETS